MLMNNAVQIERHAFPWHTNGTRALEFRRSDILFKLFASSSSVSSAAAYCEKYEPNSVLLIGVLDSMAWRAMVAFFSPHWARMLISIPESRLLMAGEHGGGIGEEFCLKCPIAVVLCVYHKLDDTVRESLRTAILCRVVVEIWLCGSARRVARMDPAGAKCKLGTFNVKPQTSQGPSFT
ncbi:hypothetical protein E6O75_ATG11086 [Venturia nashicola]|uniref:Uncharacterized protein n=1 Tax=Venturia nashicola TaxID=86259 RepID=A0A4Z1PJE0_9PEZI|nr:hypothetical protein E6O75_ATG11086 [Venturia nashicola]